MDPDQVVYRAVRNMTLLYSSVAFPCPKTLVLPICLLFIQLWTYAPHQILQL